MSTYDRADVQMAFPSCSLICGPSLSGKTSLCMKIIERADVVYEKPPTLIYYCYNEWQPIFDKLLSKAKVVMHDGLPDLDELRKLSQKERILLILDDLMVKLDKFPDAEKLFSVASHHFNMACIAIIHSIFYSKTIRNLRLNSSYLFLFKNNADFNSINILASQMYPSRRNYFISAFQSATSTPHTYLLVDNHKTTKPEFRLRSSLFLDEEFPTICFVEK